ncbi:MAG TPA: hypothetical protein VFT86_00740 [Gaiellaceae bacterium]|nr:hypothetical protein [Gaiellaceae bacterium]
MKRFALAVVFVLLLAGCGGDEESSESSGSDATASTARCEPEPGASLEKKVSPVLQDRPTMYLTDVEIEIEDCVERVIFKFDKSEPGPGYNASYQPAEVAKIQDGSGDPFPIAGGDFLVVRMFPAMTAKIDGEDVEPTYEGERSIPAPTDAKMLREVGMSGDFEAQVTWVLGLDNKRPFTATASDDELVVEISNVGATS